MASWRDLPPVPEGERPERPRRFSQTLLKLEDRCPRSALLGLLHGSAASHAMDRGSVGHETIERALRLMIQQGETTPDPDTVKVLLGEVLRERPDLVPSAREMETVRMALHHWSGSPGVPVEKVVAVERLFLLPLEHGVVSGRIDVAWVDGLTCAVRDWKFSFDVPSWEDVATRQPDGSLKGLRSFQLLLYALLLAFGVPVDLVECEECHGAGTWRGDAGAAAEAVESCPECEGRGHHVVPGRPLGDGLQQFDVGFVYPLVRPREDGSLISRSVTVDRAELIEHRAYLEALVERLAGRFESGRWPAVPGSHCGECPARSECPLPERVRGREIVDGVDAAELAEMWELRRLEGDALRRQLREWSKFHGPVRYGADLVLEFKAETRRSVRKRGGGSDWDGLARAVQGAARFGEAFELDEWVRESTSTTFGRRKLSPAELAVEREEEMGHGVA